MTTTFGIAANGEHPQQSHPLAGVAGAVCAGAGGLRYEDRREHRRPERKRPAVVPASNGPELAMVDGALGVALGVAPKQPREHVSADDGDSDHEGHVPG
jgi:hypothetical protein